MTIAFTYVPGFKIIERFSSYTLASERTARALANYIPQKRFEFSLDLNYLVSQSYDDPFIMGGCNSGVQTFLKEKCPQATYVHCSAHRLNLVLVDMAKMLESLLTFLHFCKDYMCSSLDLNVMNTSFQLRRLEVVEGLG